MNNGGFDIPPGNHPAPGSHCLKRDGMGLGLGCYLPFDHEGRCDFNVDELASALRDALDPSRAHRGTYLGAPAAFKLDQCARLLVDAFGYHTYLVGSALYRRSWRDVDVRTILSDDAFDALFPGMNRSSHENDPRWVLMCTAISCWMREQTGLPIDYQIQRRSEANAKFNCPRSALGIMLDPKGVEQWALTVKDGA